MNNLKLSGLIFFLSGSFVLMGIIISRNKSMLTFLAGGLSPIFAFKIVSVPFKYIGIVFGLVADYLVFGDVFSCYAFPLHGNRWYRKMGSLPDDALAYWLWGLSDE